MEPRVRIALVGTNLAELGSAFRALPSGPDVRDFADLFADAAALREFRPQVLVAAIEPAQPEVAGALRVLRAQEPGLGLGLVADADTEPALAPVAQRLGARLLTRPWLPGQPAAMLAHLLGGSDRPAEEVFMDLARGIADEVNNPLLVASGHLQLLEALASAGDASLRPAIAAVREGMDRIRAAVDRLRLLSKAATPSRERTVLDLHALATAAAADGAPGMPVLREPDMGPIRVLLDEPTARAALGALAGLCLEFRESGALAHWVVSRFAGCARLRLRLAGPNFAGWRLPATFEPWFAARALRGTTHGLALPLAQALTLAHGGEALARRLPDQAVAIDFLFPVAEQT